MKKIFLLLGVSLLALSSFKFQDETEAMIRSFKSANVEEIAKYFDELVDLKLLEKDEVKNMSRNQATIALKAFFSEHGINGFDKVSDREIGTTMYMAGKLLNESKGFNITIMMKQKSNKRQIITIRIS